jgi:hypothetical protein
MTAEQRPPIRRYTKPVVVPDRLEDLVGPTTGVVNLPRHLQWSGNPRYDLDQPGRIVDLYRTVLNEAAAPDDLHRYLDRSTPIRLWPTMWLPTWLRSDWELHFPELARRHPMAAA